MIFVNLTPELAASWDKLVGESDDGWMYGLSDWQRLIVEVPDWGFEDFSFGVFEEGRLVAVMPLQLTPDGRLCSTAMGPSGPIVKNGVSEDGRKRIFSGIFRHAQEIAATTGAMRIEVSVSPDSRTSLNGSSENNGLVSHGFDDASTHSWMIDLRRPKSDIWDGISRNARRKIKEATRMGYAPRPIREREEMDVYYDIHCETYRRTGATPHPKEYFLGIYDRFTKRGRSKIWIAVNAKGDPVAFTNIALHDKGALYWTTCCRDEDFAHGVYYLLLWHAIESAKDEGLEWFNCAEAFPNAPVGSKEKGLSEFKAKFGGKLHRYWKGRMVLRPSESPSAASFPRRILRGMRGVRRNIEEVAGRSAADFVASPFRVLLRTVRSARNLSDPYIPFLKPYWSAQEMEIGLGHSSLPTDPLEYFKKSFRQKLGLDTNAIIIPTGSGRTALEVALRTLRQRYPERRKVILPTYGCKGTFDPILKAGLVPVFADINDELLTDEAELGRLLSADTLAVLLVHLCGKQLEIGRMVELAKAQRVALIEDHCQNLRGGQRTSGLSIYSFGMGKNAMATAGGALVANTFQDELSHEASRLSVEPPEMARKRFAFFKSRYFQSGFGDGEKIFYEKECDPYGYRSMNPVDALMMVEQLEKLDIIIARRKNHAARLQAILSKFPEIYSFQSLKDHIYTKLSVKLAHRRMKRRFHEWMMRRGVELEEMYAPLHLRHFASGFRRESLPKSEAVYPCVMNLPVRPNLTGMELEKLETEIDAFGRSHSTLLRIH